MHALTANSASWEIYLYRTATLIGAQRLPPQFVTAPISAQKPKRLPWVTAWVIKLWVAMTNWAFSSVPT